MERNTGPSKFTTDPPSSRGSFTFPLAYNCLFVPCSALLQIEASNVLPGKNKPATTLGHSASWLKWLINLSQPWETGWAKGRPLATDLNQSTLKLLERLPVIVIDYDSGPATSPGDFLEDYIKSNITSTNGDLL